jgi:SulP family sulfate permease
LEGVALGVILALVVLIRRVSRPATAQLGRLPGTDTYRDITVRSEVETIPGLLIFRFDAPIIFANAAYFAEQVRQLISDAATPIQEVLVPAQQINQLDSTGADQLAKLHSELGGKGIAFSFAEVKRALREAMLRTGLEEKIGADHFYESIEEGVQSFLQRQTQMSGEQE